MDPVVYDPSVLCGGCGPPNIRGPADLVPLHGEEELVCESGEESVHQGACTQV